MSKKTIVIIVAAMLIMVGAVAGITVAMNPAEETAAPTAESTEASAGTSATTSTEASGTSGKEAAEALIGQQVTKDDVEKAVGKWEKFEMSSNGCERGVYAGRFYYDGFNIFSRTYDKGKTFSIVSINE